MRRLAIILALLCADCRSIPLRSSTDALILSKNIGDGARDWQDAFERKYHVRPAVLVVHGGDNDGHWTFGPDSGGRMDAETAIRVMRAMIPPSKPLCVISCNPGGYRVNVPGVWYALDTIWSRPGADTRWSWRDFDEETYVGSVDELVEGGK